MENVYLIIIIIRAFVRRTMSAQLNLRHLDSLSLHFNGHFPGEPGLAGSYWSKGWRKCWWQLDYWSYKSCKAPVKWSQPTNQQPVFFYRSDALPVTQPTVSKHWREKYHILWTCLPQAHLGVFQLCLWPLIAPGNLWWQQQVGVLSSSVYQQWVDVCCSWGYRKSGFRWTCPVFGRLSGWFSQIWGLSRFFAHGVTLYVCKVRVHIYSHMPVSACYGCNILAYFNSSKNDDCFTELLVIVKFFLSSRHTMLTLNACFQ